MINKCPTCDAPVAPDDALNLGATLEEARDWYSWPAAPSKFTLWFRGSPIEVNLIDRNVIAYEEQGNETEVWLLFRIEDKFYKKYGTGDSYGDVDWDGPFKEVYKSEKVVTVYE